MKLVQFLLIATLVALASTNVCAAPSAIITASPSICSVSDSDDVCEITLSYSATDIPDGWVVEVLDTGFNFLASIAAPGVTTLGEFDVLVSLPGKNFGVVLNQGLADGELLATVEVMAETELLPGDADGDGVGDEDDAFPNDPNEFQDSDGDGIGDNAENASGGGGSSGSGGSGGGSSGSANGVNGAGIVIAGEVELIRQGDTSGSAVSQINVLQAGDIIRTGAAASLDLTLQDGAGSSASLVLGESSEFLVEEVASGGTDAVWSVLNSGIVSVVFDRQTGNNSESARRCPVRTPNAGVCARGTEYTIEYSLVGFFSPSVGIGRTVVSVTEGTVELIGATGELVALVDAGESFTYDAAEPASFPQISSSYAGTAYLMTTSTSANVTQLHIVNTSNVAQSFTGTLFQRSGEQLGDTGVSLAAEMIPANGRLVLNSQDLEDIFSVEPWRGPAMLEIEGIAPFEMMTKLINPSGLVSNTNCVRDQSALNVEGFDSDVLTFIRFINTTDSTITDIRGALYDEAGALIGDDDVVFIGSLKPKQQVWINRDQFAEILGREWAGVGALQINEMKGLKLLNLNFVNGDTFFNFTCFERSDSGFVFLQTTSTSQNISLTHFINTSQMPQQFRGSLYSKSGAALGGSDQPLHEGTILPNGRLVLSSSDLESVFGVSAWSGPALLEVTGSGSFELMTRLTSPSGLVSNSNCIRDREVHNVEGFDSPVLSFVRLVNTGTEVLNGISAVLHDANGDVIGAGVEEIVASLPGKSAIWLNRNDLSDIYGETWVGEASLSVTTTNKALKLLNLNFANSETFTNFSCYEIGL